MLAISFQGCACRAAFYAGVAMALEEGKLPIQLTSGASSGALSAVAVAAGKAKELPSIWKSLGGRSIVSLRRILWNRSIFDMSHLVRSAVVSSLGSLDLRQSPMEALVVATRMRSLRPVVFSSREEPSMLEPAMGSAFFPVLYGRPVQVRGEYLLDGGFSDNLPIELLESKGATEVIAVFPSAEGVAFKDLRRRRWSPRLHRAKLHLLYPRQLLPIKSWDFDRDRMSLAIDEGYARGREFLGQ